MGCMFSQLAAKFAFFPPTPPTYQIKKNENGKLTAVSSSSSMPIPLADDNSLDILLIDTKRGNKIVAFYLKNPYARLTLLYSHGNAADLGQLYDLFVQLKVNLRVNIMGYDYSGYGASTGKPSEYNTYADIEAVYQCLQTEYGVSQEDIILYGQSVGSGPTLHLASKLPRLRGVVLHSGILSGLRVLCHVKFSFCFDIYTNINKMKKVKCPVLVIHGTEDDVVNFLHGNKLWKMARDPYEPLWIKGGGHCNLELYPDYIRHLCKFIQEMENMTTKARLNKIRQTLNLPKRSSTTTSSSSCCCSCRISCCCRPRCFECPKPRCFQCCPKPRCFQCCPKPSWSCISCCPKPSWSCISCCPKPSCSSCCPSSCTSCCPNSSCTSCCPNSSCTSCCPKPSCTSCCPKPSCVSCCPKPSCISCCPKPSCISCFPKLSCISCCSKPKCPKCRIPSCLKCCRCFKWPKCLSPCCSFSFTCSCCNVKCLNLRCCVKTEDEGGKRDSR